MSLRDRLLRLRSTQAAQAERLAGMTESPVESVPMESPVESPVESAAADADTYSTKATNGGMQWTNVAEAEEEAEEISMEHAVGEVEPIKQSLEPAWEELGVQLIESTDGAFLVRESRYPLAHWHGSHRLAELVETQPALAAFDREINYNQGSMKLLFLDLETTGLGVGAGNVPFMVGLAYMLDDMFIVKQMLIRHPAEERAMIGYLRELLPSFTHLVTYNGRTFDWPVLYNRFILHGYRTFAWNPVHIDLLHPSRSVWRNTLVSCRLSHVEEERLGIKREDDVPGSLAPAIYFQYLADGDPEPLLGVFQHNETDMLSLAALAIRFGHFLGGGMGTRIPLPDEAEELLRTGLWLERMGKAELAESLYARFAVHARPSAKCLCLLAERDKKCGNWHRAVLLWQKAVHLSADLTWPDYEAHIELAMYYEHRTKELEQALLLAEQAFEMAARRQAGHRLQSKRRTELDLIRKRIDRLRLKRSKG